MGDHREKVLTRHSWVLSNTSQVSLRYKEGYKDTGGPLFRTCLRCRNSLESDHWRPEKEFNLTVKGMKTIHCWNIRPSKYCFRQRQNVSKAPSEILHRPEVWSLCQPLLVLRKPLKLHLA